MHGEIIAECLHSIRSCLMNNHERLLISNNRGQVSVNALERSQFCMAFSRIYHGMSLVSYKSRKKKASWKALNLIVKKKNRQREKCRGKRFIIATCIFLFCFAAGCFRMSSWKVTACLLMRDLEKQNPSPSLFFPLNAFTEKHFVK